MRIAIGEREVVPLEPVRLVKWLVQDSKSLCDTKEILEKDQPIGLGEPFHGFYNRRRQPVAKVLGRKGEPRFILLDELKI